MEAKLCGGGRGKIARQEERRDSMHKRSLHMKYRGMSRCVREDEFKRL